MTNDARDGARVVCGMGILREARDNRLRALRARERKVDVGTLASLAFQGSPDTLPSSQLHSAGLSEGIQRGLEMKKLRELKDLAIHDVRPVSDERNPCVEPILLHKPREMTHSTQKPTLHFEPSLDALSLRSDVMSSIMILSPPPKHSFGV